MSEKFCWETIDMRRPRYLHPFDPPPSTIGVPCMYQAMNLLKTLPFKETPDRRRNLCLKKLPSFKKITRTSPCDTRVHWVSARQKQRQISRGIELKGPLRSSCPLSLAQSRKSATASP